MKQTIMVEGMKCDGCANNVNQLFSELAGVKSVMVDREAKTAHVETERELSLDEFSHALAQTKYLVTEVK